MKYLKIENQNVTFLKADNTTYENIENITKDDILFLLDSAIEGEFEMDNPVEKEILNPARKIIYEHLFKNFSDLLVNKETIKQEAESLYKDAIEKYSK